jgi:signal peptidase II
MPELRRSLRTKVDLRVTVDVVREGTERRFHARAVDLSQTGIGLLGPLQLDLGQVLRLTIGESPELSSSIGREWAGRVASVCEGTGGRRVGIAFALEPETTDLHPRRRRSQGESRRSVALRRGESQAQAALWVAMALALASAGLAIDQVSKWRAFHTTNAITGLEEIALGIYGGVQARNYGAMDNLFDQSPLTRLLCALNSLVVTGLALRWALRHTENWRGREALAAGVLVAGVMGNSIDRLLIGYVRDFLAIGDHPYRIFNLADVFVMSGTVVLVVSVVVRYGHTWARTLELRRRPT